MTSLIKKLHKICDISVCIFAISAIVLTILTLTSGISYIRLYFNKDIYDKYKSYYDISAEIKDGTINGRLNQYITIKYKNNICYTKYCGFPQEGTYQLSSIQFYQLDKYEYVFKSCINEDKECFYNITDDSIKELKVMKLQELKDDIKTGLICSLVFLLGGFLQAKINHHKYSHDE